MSSSNSLCRDRAVVFFWFVALLQRQPSDRSYEGKKRVLSRTARRKRAKIWMNFPRDNASTCL